MLLHLDGKKHRIQVLLITGCCVALLNNQTVEKLGITKKEHRQAHTIENYTGERVKGASQFYTEPMLLQHRRHYSKERFEISPMETGIDAFLPFEWITAHPPQGIWTNNEIRFNSGMRTEMHPVRNKPLLPNMGRINCNQPWGESYRVCIGGSRRRPSKGGANGVSAIPGDHGKGGRGCPSQAPVLRL